MKKYILMDQVLRDAAERGDELKVRKLLSRGTSALSVDGKGMTALMLASACGEEGCVNALLPVSDALVGDAGGKTALMLASGNGHEGCLRALLPVSDASAVERQFGWTALMCASWRGHGSCVSALLPVSDPLTVDKDGRTALMHASRNGNEGCLMILLPVSDALVLDNRSWTALMYASRMGHEGCVAGAMSSRREESNWGSSEVRHRSAREGQARSPDAQSCGAKARAGRLRSRMA